MIFLLTTNVINQSRYLLSYYESQLLSVLYRYQYVLTEYLKPHEQIYYK